MKTTNVILCFAVSFLVLTSCTNLTSIGDKTMVNTITISHEDGNTTPRLAAVCANLKAGQENWIVFEKGIYHFRKDGSLEREVNAVNVLPGMKHVIVNLEDAQNVVIDGNGSEFIFDDIVFPFSLIRCRHVTLRNFTIDFSFSRYCQGEVVQSDESGFELSIDPAVFRVDVDEKGHVIFHSSDLSVSTEERPILIGNVIFGRAPWDYVYAGDSRRAPEGLPTSHVLTHAVKTEKGIRFTYLKDSRRLVFPLGDQLLFCYEPRQNVNILASHCEDIHIENVTMYRGGGMGIVLARSSNVYLDNVSIQVRPGRNESRSTTADGVYMVQCSGTVSIRNSLISSTLDDALNIHGIYFKVSGVSSRALTLEGGLPEHGGFQFAEAGDRIEISDGQTHRRKGMFTVTAIKVLPDGRLTCSVDGDCSIVAAGDIVENQSRVPTFIFENNRVAHCPHLRISDNGRHLIRNNVFDGIQCILVQDLLAYWYESGAVADMLIEQNTFMDSPRSRYGYPIEIGSTRQGSSDVRHHNIRILNNQFSCPNGQAINASAIEGLEIRGNRFDGGPQDSMLHIDACTNVTLQDNTFSATTNSSK